MLTSVHAWLAQSPTFVPNSNGTTSAAWEGFLLAREPNRCIPGLRQKKIKDKAPAFRNKAGRDREGLCHHLQRPQSVLRPRDSAAWSSESKHREGREPVWRRHRGQMQASHPWGGAGEGDGSATSTNRARAVLG